MMVLSDSISLTADDSKPHPDVLTPKLVNRKASQRSAALRQSARRGWLAVSVARLLAFFRLLPEGEFLMSVGRFGRFGGQSGHSVGAVLT
jgi:hypothetical protein